MKINVELDTVKHKLAVGLAVILKHEPDASIEFDTDWDEIWLGNIILTKEKMTAEECHALIEAEWQEKDNQWYTEF